MLFFDDSLGRSVEVSDYFPDIKKFIQTLSTLQQAVGTDLLDWKKRYHLIKRDCSEEKVLKVSKLKRKISH